MRCGATSRAPTWASRCPDFPNLFCLYGPATNLAHAGSIIFHSECQVRYITECIKTLIENGAKAMDCRRDVYEDYSRRLAAELDTLVWSHPACDSWSQQQGSRRDDIAVASRRLLDLDRGPKLEDYRADCVSRPGCQSGFEGALQIVEEADDVPAIERPMVEGE